MRPIGAGGSDDARSGAWVQQQGQEASLTQLLEEVIDADDPEREEVVIKGGGMLEENWPDSPEHDAESVMPEAPLTQMLEEVTDAPGEDAALSEVRASGEDADGSEISDACTDAAASDGSPATASGSGLATTVAHEDDIDALVDKFLHAAAAPVPTP